MRFDFIDDLLSLFLVYLIKERGGHRKMSAQDEFELRINSGMKSGLVGLITNLLLAVLKVFAGITAGSVSILADAINSFGDTASAILTMGGFYIANKPADKEHPYGHQRAEYISGLIISIIIMIVGFEFFMSSIEKIMNPTSVKSSKLVFIILGLSVLVKIGLAFYYQSLNKEIESESIVLTALVKDSINDALMTLVIIFSYLIEVSLAWKLDGYIGAVVALFIVYSGVMSIIEASNNLLGIRPDSELVEQMRDVLDSYENILDYHDLLIHKYGPGNYFVTVDIEMDSRWTLLEAHKVIDDIEREFKEKFNSTTVCHLDPIVLDNEVHNEIYAFVKRTLKNRDEKFHFHDFRVIDYKQTKEIHFDLVIPKHLKDSDEQLYEFLEKALAEKYGDYRLDLKFDRYYLLE